MISLLFPAIVIAIIVWLVRRSRHGASGGEHELSEFAFSAELFVLGVLTIVATVGASGLFTRLLDALAGLTLDDDVSAVARSLAFALIAGPLAALVWWRVWKRPVAELTASVVWSFFLTVMGLVSLLVWSISGLEVLRRAAEWRFDRGGFAQACAWVLVWVALRWIHRRSSHRPVAIPDISAGLGAVVGLGLMLGGATALLSGLWRVALDAGAEVLAAGTVGVWQNLGGWAAFTVGAGAIWWLHWVHDDARSRREVVPGVLVAMSGIVAPAIMTLSGTGIVIYHLLRSATGDGGSLSVAEPGPAAGLAVALVGATAWAYHRNTLRGHVDALRWGTGLVLSGIGLVGAATGLGIVVNAALGSFVETVGGSGMSNLLCGGLSTFAVSVPLWVAAWRPGLQLRDPRRRHWSGRLIYLVIVFSASAITALVTAITIAYISFEYLLRTGAKEGLLDEIRGALGLLVATAVVAGYHFPVWRRDRVVRREQREAAGEHPRLRNVMLVVGADLEPDAVDDLVRSIRGATGATVTRLTRLDVATPVGALVPGDLTAALATVGAERALVVTGGLDGFSVIPLRS